MIVLVSILRMKASCFAFKVARPAYDICATRDKKYFLLCIAFPLVLGTISGTGAYLIRVRDTHISSHRMKAVIIDTAQSFRNGCRSSQSCHQSDALSQP